MEDNLKSSVLNVCKLLEKYSIPYMLVGGTAVALNGYFRLSVNTTGEVSDKPE